MRTLVAALIVAATLPLIPTTFAHHCAEPAPDQSGGTGIDLPDNDVVSSPTLYLFVDLEDGVSLWTESGQEDGLQADNGTCRTSNGNNGHYGRDCEAASVHLDATYVLNLEECGVFVTPPALP